MHTNFSGLNLKKHLLGLGWIIVFLHLSSTEARSQTAQFSADLTEGCLPLIVKFKDLSTGNPTAWTWDFGNGNSSTFQNPSATYNLPGVYNITLTITTGTGNDTETKMGFIKVGGEPNVDFSADVRVGCAPFEVKFTDLSDPTTGTISEWEWVFGDGSTSNEKNPTHVFEQNGEHNVTLFITNSGGCQNSRTRTAYINSKKPTSLFSPSGTSFCSVPSNVIFTNTSTGNGALSYLWNFGDGNTSTAASPSHDYTIAGIYTASLRTEDIDGCFDTYKVDIDVLEQLPADIFVSSNKICVGDTILVEDRTAGLVVSRDWDFGDGRVSTLESQDLIYNTPGTYPISITLEMADGCIAQETVEVEVIPYPVPSFTYRLKCDFLVEFTNTSVNTESVEWDFGGLGTSTETNPSFTFPAKGNYIITLKGYNALDCDSLIEREIFVPGNPIASFKPNNNTKCSQTDALEGCAPFEVLFTNSTNSFKPYTSKWYFGDGDSSLLNAPTHIFEQEGTFTVILEVTDNEGCTNSFQAIAKVGSVKPQVDIEISKTVVCVGDEIVFTDKLGQADFWCWDLGNGSNMSGQSIAYTYNEPGIYSISLSARKGGCGELVVLDSIIEVQEPLVKFTVSKDCFDDDRLKFYFINAKAGTVPEESWFWDFGDGQTSTDFSPSHKYSQMGSYTVSLNGSNSTTSCSITKTQEVVLDTLIADGEISQTIVCKGVELEFINKSLNATYYGWSMGDGIEYTDLPDVKHTYQEAGDYQVKLVVGDRYGCGKSKLFNVKVIDIAGKYSYEGVSDCNTLEVKFTDESTSDNGISAWFWDFGDGASSTEQHPVHQYTTSGRYNVSLTLTDGLGGQCTVVKKQVIVFQVPVVDFVVSDRKACAGETIQFTNLSDNAASYEWDFGNGQSSDQEDVEIQYDQPGNFTVSLTANDPFGCSKTLTKTNEIEVSQPLAEFAVDSISAECPPLTSRFEDTSEGNIQFWDWDFGDGNHSTLSSPTYVFSIPGTYQVSLKVTDANGCDHSKTFQDLFVVGGPYGTFDLNYEVCLSDTVTFSTEAINTTKYYWDFGDGSVIETSVDSIQYKYQVAGDYSPALVLEDDKACKVPLEAQELLIVNKNPLDNFFVSQPYPFLGDQINLKGRLFGSIYRRKWYVDGELVGEGESISYQPTTTGIHLITLFTLDENGCESITTKELIVQDAITFIPNAFTPNGDELNPTFTILGLEEGSWALKVFNRWGRVVYEASPYQGDWAANNVHKGVYYYSLQNIYRPEKQYHGSIDILR